MYMGCVWVVHLYKSFMLKKVFIAFKLSSLRERVLCELKLCCFIEIKKMSVETIKIFVKSFNWLQ